MQVVTAQLSSLALRSSSAASTSGRPTAPMHFSSGRSEATTLHRAGSSSFSRKRCLTLLGRAVAYETAAEAAHASASALNGAAAGGLAAAAPAEHESLSAEAAAPPEDDVPDSEMLRRAKISAANKGRVPWNKGRKHSPEIRAKIKEKTRAAMQRPDVRAKLAIANQQRPGHTEEAKAKIRAKLQAKVEVERAVISEQVARILGLEAPEDERERECLAHPRAERVISGMAWQHFKKLQDYEMLVEHWQAPGSAFREASMGKLWRMVEKRAAYKARPRATKIKRALELVKKLEDAQQKLAQADQLAATFRRALPALEAAGDPRQAQVAASVQRTEEVADKIREQVAKLTGALEPLLPLLESASAAEKAGGEGSQAAELSMAAANGAVPVNGVAAANGTRPTPAVAAN